MYIVIAFVLGVIIGTIISRIFIFFKKPKYIGVLRIDRSDPDTPPYMFLEIFKDASHEIKQDQYVTFKVDFKDYISRE